MADYMDRSPRDYLAVATPGAGKTTFALTVAAELLGRRIVDRIIVVAPTEHLKLQWAEAGARAGIPIDPAYSAGKGKTSKDYVGIAVTYAGVAVNPLAMRIRTDNYKTLVILDEVHHAGDAHVVGRGRPGGVPARDPAAGPDGHAVPLGRQPDPVRHLRPRAPTASRARSPTSPTATSTRSPTTSCGRCCSWRTPVRCSGAPAPATRWPPGSASR